MKYKWPQNIIMFIPEGSSVPSGWSLVTSATGKLIRSGVAHGATGGGSHTHTFNPGAVYSGFTTVGSSYDCQVGVSTNKLDFRHRHVIDRSQITSGGEEAVPPYIDVLVVSKD